jgi:GTP-binding protein EngB required for normal cell division
MVNDVTARASALRTALEEGAENLDPAVVESTGATVSRVVDRLKLGGDHTVVALVGATGSGKSSLFNALARMDIAEVGARRPLTSLPMACVWGDDSSDELLDWLEVPAERRVVRESVLDADSQAPLHGLVLLDLPDHDSTEVVHRVEVDRLVEQVDLLVWVVDPQKYADDALHSGYLQRMGDHDGVMVVVLNQIDRLGPDEAETCRRDLRRLLDGDGLQAVRVVPLSARRGDGVDELRELLASVVQDRSAIAQRLDADLRSAVTSVRSGVAPAEHAEPPGVDALVSEMAAAAGVHTVLDALSAEYRRRGMARVGWPVPGWLHRLTPKALGRLGNGVADDDLRVIATSLMPMSAPSQRPRVELAVESLVSASSEGLPRRWVDAVRSSVGGSTALISALDAAVADVDLELRPPAWWRVVGVLQIMLALTAFLGFAWLLVGGVGSLLGGSGSLLGMPLSLILLVVGLVAGGLLAVGSGWLLRADAARRRAAAQDRMYAAVSEVASSQVVSPVVSVLRQHRRTREALLDADDSGTTGSSASDSSSSPETTPPSASSESAVPLPV